MGYKQGATSEQEKTLTEAQLLGKIIVEEIKLGLSAFSFCVVAI